MFLGLFLFTFGSGRALLAARNLDKLILIYSTFLGPRP